MTLSDNEDETLAHYLEFEVLSEVSDQEEEEVEKEAKRLRVGDDREGGKLVESSPFVSSAIQFQVQSKGKIVVSNDWGNSSDGRGIRATSRSTETGFFSQIPPELFHHILKFLSSEDLVSCSLVCRFLNFAASDESMWRRLFGCVQLLLENAQFETLYGLNERMPRQLRT